MQDRKLLLLCFALLFSWSCKDEVSFCEVGLDLECSATPWDESAFALPFPAGTSYRVNQGNNNPCGGHQGAYKYSYDFDMPIGTIITAARTGVVSETRTDNPDGVDLVLGNENLVKILHADGTTAAYSHMKQHSILVAVGDTIQVGDTLGLSGNSGYTGNFPHLHFHWSDCDEPTDPGCRTMLVKFRNTSPNPCGLEHDEWYEAL